MKGTYKMNKLFNIIFKALFFTTIIIISILSIAFIFIEGRFVFSLEWTIYDFSFLTFIKYLFRFILPLIILFYVVMEFINFKKKNDILMNHLFILNISFIILSILLCIFAANYIGIISLVLSSITLISKVLISYTKV